MDGGGEGEGGEGEGEAEATAADETMGGFGFHGGGRLDGGSIKS
jgi:hypothetical protein